MKQLRKRMGLSIRSLAATTGFSPSLLSQIERGQVSPSLHSMEKIATALGATLSAFFAGLGEGDGGLIVRARDRRALNSSWSHAQIEVLTPGGDTSGLEPMVVTLRAGAQSGKHPVAHSAAEFAYVLEGRPTLRLGPDEHVLGAGDAVLVRPGELRLWGNRGPRRARVLIVVRR